MLKTRTRIETVVIGGGQAGLSVGYYLAQQGIPFVILDAHSRIGDAWRRRWDSLRLFTPARYDGLLGLRFPAKGDIFRRKIRWLTFSKATPRISTCPFAPGMKVDKLSREDGRFVVNAGDALSKPKTSSWRWAAIRQPRVPDLSRPRSEDRAAAFARLPESLAAEGGWRPHRRCRELRADIALEVARTHRTWLAGKESGHVPFRIETFAGRFILVRIVRFIGHHVLTVATPIGRRLRPKLRFAGDAADPGQAAGSLAAGIERVSRVAGVKDGRPLLDDGRVLDVANVIWCTGFTNGFSWIDLPIFGADGEPIYDRGIVPNAFRVCILSV